MKQFVARISTLELSLHGSTLGDGSLDTSAGITAYIGFYDENHWIFSKEMELSAEHKSIYGIEAEITERFHVDSVAMHPSIVKSYQKLAKIYAEYNDVED